LGQALVSALFAARSRISAGIWLIVRDTQAAEDIFQATSVKALTKGGPFTSQAQLFSWVQVTARHAAIDWLRRRKSECVVLEGEVLDLLEEQAAKAAVHVLEGARVDALRDCLEAIPARSREMLELRYFEGRSCEEVADVFDLKLAAVYQRLSRLHRALKECIERRIAGGMATLNPHPEVP